MTCNRTFRWPYELTGEAMQPMGETQLQVNGCWGGTQPWCMLISLTLEVRHPRMHHIRLDHRSRTPVTAP